MIEDKLLIWRFNRGNAAALCRIYEWPSGSGRTSTAADRRASMLIRSPTMRTCPTVHLACRFTVSLKNGHSAEQKLIVQFRELAGRPSCVVYGPCGRGRENE